MEKIDERLYCATSVNIDKHLIIEPVELSCSHFICKDCVPTTVSHDHLLRCDICKRLNLNDLLKVNQSTKAKQLIKDNLDLLFNYMLTDFEKTVSYWKDNNDIDKCIDSQIKLIKFDIKQKIQVLKLQLDQLGKDLESQLDDVGLKIKNENSRKSYEGFDSVAEHHLESLKKHMQIDESKTVESLSAYQTMLQKLQQMVDESQNVNPRLILNENGSRITKQTIGTIVQLTEKNAIINSHLKSTQYKLISINSRPYDLCVLPHEQLLVADSLNQQLILYGKNFKLMRIIDKLDSDEFQPISITTNMLNEVYVLDAFSEDNYKLHKLDFELNQLATFICNGGSGIVQLNGPRCICYSNGFLYVCDTNNKRIQKFTTNFQYKTVFNLNMTPIRMQVVDNSACIRDYNTINFYDLENFTLRYKYDRRGYGLIGGINSFFYEYYHKRVFFYDKTGCLLEEFQVGDFSGQLNDFGYYCGICYFSHKLIFYHFDSVKLILV